jgi:hypothetical protein
MVSAIDPKWEEEMLAVAKDDHRLALQVMHEEAPEGGAAPVGEVVGVPGDGVAAGEEGGERPRRGPRRSPEAEFGKE